MTNIIQDLLDQIIDKYTDIVTPEKPKETGVLSNTQTSKSVVSPKLPSKETTHNSIGYQNPIKTTYYCSGIFGVGDARHKGIHNGSDLRVAGGTPVYPIADGVVISAAGGGKGGNAVVIQHVNKLTSRYAHLGTMNVKVKDVVNKNTVIGTVGDSGNAVGTAPHIHFEIKENGQFVNPNKYIHVPTYTTLQPNEKGKLWLSQKHKNKADLARGKMSAISKIDKLEKLANMYYNLAIQS